MPCPLPVFEGIDDGSRKVTPAASFQDDVGVDVHPPRAASGAFTISTEEKERYRAAFISCSPENGLVPGDKARDLFVKGLADSQNTGSLNQEQFMVAMYFMLKIKSGALASPPTSIPSALWSALATPGPSTPVLSRTTSAAAAGGIPPTLRKLSQSTVQSTGSSSALNTPAETVPADIRVQSEQYFDQLDTSKRGYLTGNDAYGFFLKSKLPEAELARIWDACDKSKTGRLSRDHFAAAMHMIKQSMTSGSGGRSSVVVQSSPAPDLLDFSSSPSSPACKSSVATNPLVPTSSFEVAKPTTIAEPITLFKPLVPPSVTRAPPARSATISHTSSSLLSSAVPDIETEIATKRAEVADISGQLEALTPTNDALRVQRESLDAELKAVQEEKNAITIKMSQARALYQAESQILVDAKNQLSREQAVMEASRAEYANMESALAHMSAEKEKTLVALQATIHESSELKAKCAEYVEQGTLLREQLATTRTELEAAQKVLVVNQRLLQAAEMEYTQLKDDIGENADRLERERSRSTAMQNQIAVQSAISDKERKKLECSQDELTSIMSSNQSMAASVAVGADDFKPVLNEKPPEAKTQYTESVRSAPSVGGASPQMMSAVSPNMPATDQVSVRSVELASKNSTLPPPSTSPVGSQVPNKAVAVIGGSTTAKPSTNSAAKKPLAAAPGTKTVPSTATAKTVPALDKQKTAVTVKQTPTANSVTTAKPGSASSPPKTTPQEYQQLMAAASSNSPAVTRKAVSPKKQVTKTAVAKPAASSVEPTASSVKPVSNPLIAAKKDNVSLLDLDEPPLPPQSTKPTAPPGQTDALSLAFSGISTNPSSMPPAKFETAFQGFGDGAGTFDFDAAFQNSIAAAPPPVPGAFDAAFSSAADGKEVAELVSMGFDRAAAVRALEKHGYSIELATNELLK